MTEREALKLALEALNAMANEGWLLCGPEGLDKAQTTCVEAIPAIKEALAQPAVFLAEWSYWRDMVVVNIMNHGNIDKHLARELANHFQKAIPQRKPLTDAEIESMWPLRPTDEIVVFARAIEAAHGIKGGA